MAELNLKQITDKLNTEFSGEVRKLVFWYDANAEFVDDVDTLELANAKVLHLEPDNQFYVKYFLECEDTTTNYLIYAPFAKPAIRDNHLADTIRYSKEFFADRASLLTLDLGIDTRFKPVIQHYIKFFGSKARTQAFYDLELETFNRNTIEVALMSVLCKCKTPSYEEVLRTILTESGFEENPYLAEFEKYDLLDSFWRMADDLFGYSDPTPTLEKFTISMFVTYVQKSITSELPSAWKAFASYKAGNVIAFLDNLMNSYVYGERFDEISALVYEKIKGAAELQKLPIDSMVDCGVFAGVDELFINWLTKRLELEDVGARLNGITIPALISLRRKNHFGRYRKDEYYVLEHAFFILENSWHLISNRESIYEPYKDLNALEKQYTGKAYQMDMHYRYFYFHMDKMEDSSRFEQLTSLVENVYTNEYLNKLTVNWNELFTADPETLNLTKQGDFFNRHVNYSKDQVVVIISDAMRYEVGVSLLERLQADEKCNAIMKTMQTVLPSITRMGMAALLPHRNLDMDDTYAVTVDGKAIDTTEQRQAILQSAKPNSRCVQFDEIKNMSVADLRGIFTRQDVVYIYHNQIDARGDKFTTENEVFNACEEAVEEIAALIRRLTTSANKTHFIVTSDHGFIYKRNKLTESDKITISSTFDVILGRRYYLSTQAADVAGTMTTRLATYYRMLQEHVMSFPAGSDVFKAPGAGMNYVHGGTSPQEMIIPVIDVKTEKGHKETTTAQIALVSLLNKVTNLITSVDFVQTEAVSDVVKETSYRLYFITEDGQKISNEQQYVADKKDADTVKRMFRLRFSFKNRKYDRSQKYYLVAQDANNDLEVIRHEVIMDIAFADDFGFGF